MSNKSLRVSFGSKSSRIAAPLAAVALGGISSHATSRIPQVINNARCESAVEDLKKSHLNVPMGAQTLTQRPVIIVYKQGNLKWTNEDEDRFLDLAKKEALGEASSSQLQDLESMSERRLSLKHQFTLEELVWNAKQEEARAELLEAMQRFLRVQVSPSWAGAKEVR